MFVFSHRSSAQYLCYFLLFYYLTNPQLAIAQAPTATLEGKITHEGKVLAGATLWIESLQKGTNTAAEGFFRFNDLALGQYTIRISLVGYQTQYQQVTINTANLHILNTDLKEDALSLHQVVVTGTRSEVAQYDSPVVVSHISNKKLANTQSLTLSEGLNFSSGLRVENNCQNCGFTQVRMNGLSGAYSQILINSRPIFSALAGVYALEMMPANMIDRVEIVRGGGSVLYGGNAIAGTINILTKEPTENTLALSLHQAWINRHTPDNTLMLSGSLVSNNLNQGVHFYAYHRNRSPWDANNDGFSEMTKLRNYTLGFDAYKHLNERAKLKVGGYYIQEFRRGGSDFDLLPHQSRIAEQLQHHIGGVHSSLEIESPNLQHTYTLYAAVQIIRRNSYYGSGGRVLLPMDTPTAADSLALNAYGVSQDYMLQVGGQYAYKPHKNIALALGTEYQYNRVRDEMLGYGRNIRQSVGVWGSFLQATWKPTQKLSFLAGLRWDKGVIQGNYQLVVNQIAERRVFQTIVPRFTAMYRWHRDFTLRASFAQGYRAPQAFNEDLHIETVGGAAKFIQLAPNLQMERSNSATLSLNYQNSHPDLPLNLLVESFYTKLSNPFILSSPVELDNGASLITKRNGTGARVAGINAELQIAWDKVLTLQTGATWQQALYQNPEVIWEAALPDDTRPALTTKTMLRTPQQYGYLTLNYKPLKYWALAYSFVFTGRMKVAHLIEPETEYTILKQTPIFWEHHLKVSRNLKIHKTQELQLYIGMHNIFNAFQRDFDVGITRDASYVYGATRPRMLFIGLNWQLR